MKQLKNNPSLKSGSKINWAIFKNMFTCTAFSNTNKPIEESSSCNILRYCYLLYFYLSILNFPNRNLKGRSDERLINFICRITGLYSATEFIINAKFSVLRLLVFSFSC